MRAFTNFPIWFRILKKNLIFCYMKLFFPIKKKKKEIEKLRFFLHWKLVFFLCKIPEKNYLWLMKKNKYYNWIFALLCCIMMQINRPNWEIFPQTLWIESDIFLTQFLGRPVFLWLFDFTWISVQILNKLGANICEIEEI